MNSDPSHHESESEGFWRSRYAIGFILFGAVAVYFLLSEHRAHFFGALPYLLLLACPLMHVFMHHGHGDSHSHHSDQPQKPGTQSNKVLKNSESNQES